MTAPVKMGLIIGASILCATGLWIYFSDHQTCVRTMMDWHKLSAAHAARACVMRQSSRN